MPTRKFSSDLNNLEKICTFITRYAKQAGLDERQVYAVQLAVDEAATNIIEHGYRSSGEGEVVITCRPEVDGLRIILHDHAPPFNPDEIPPPVTDTSLEDLKPRGLGIFLMRKMMDEVHYQFDAEHGNTLTMLKKR
jgi:anti-sigma regulatory factor (Ser/Thr protein kinase)